jgi:DNA-binding MarR family transcriptional regulator
MRIKDSSAKPAIEDLFFALQKKIYDSIKKEVKDMNCSIPQIELMKHLKEHHSISLTETAQLLSVSKPSASVMIDGMEARGMVRRTIPESDRRSVVITLTPKSVATIRTIEEKKKKVIAVLLKKMSPKERSDLAVLLEKLIIA